MMLNQQVYAQALLLAGELEERQSQLLGLGNHLIRYRHTFRTQLAPSQILPKPEMEVMAARSS